MEPASSFLPGYNLLAAKHLICFSTDPMTPIFVVMGNKILVAGKCTMNVTAAMALMYLGEDASLS